MPLPAAPTQQHAEVELAIARAEALLDGLLEAYVAHHRAREADGPATPRPVDVGRRRLIESIGRTRRTIEHLRTLDRNKS